MRLRLAIGVLAALLVVTVAAPAVAQEQSLCLGVLTDARTDLTDRATVQSGIADDDIVPPASHSSSSW